MGNSDGRLILNTSSKVWCMLKLNKIVFNDICLNLGAIGFDDDKIIIIDLFMMKIHQAINTKSTVYSMTQFKDDSKYLNCSLSNGQLNIYLLKGNKFELSQTLEKPIYLDSGEINKVIIIINF